MADLDTHRDRAMVLGGLRAAEVRSLRFADVDMGMRRLRVLGKGVKERVVPVDDAFFLECAGYQRSERPSRCRSPECLVVLRGPTRGQPLTEAGLRKIFRTHRARSGATRVRPDRLRHTCVRRAGGDDVSIHDALSAVTNARATDRPPRASKNTPTVPVVSVVMAGLVVSRPDRHELVVQLAITTTAAQPEADWREWSYPTGESGRTQLARTPSSGPK